MNAIIPKKRRDGKSSFEDLVSYVSVRDDLEDEELQALSSAQSLLSHRSRFSRLVDYATRLRDESFVSLVDVMKDGCEWVNFYGVTCFHNCTSLETAAEEMEYTARQARYAKDDTDPVFHYILSWQSHESPRPEQIYDSVRHTLKALGLSSHQYVSAVHTDTDNLHVHVAVNRVHPDTGYLNCLSWSQEKLSRACRELELKHGFAPDNGCWIHAPGSRIVRKTAAERDRQNAWTRGKKQTFREYVSQTAVAGLRSEPVHDWLSLHRRLAEDGLYLTLQNGSFMVMDGWDRNREGVQLDSFGPSWNGDKLRKKMGEYTPVPKDIFSQVGAPGRYKPEVIAADTRPEKMAETVNLMQYACRHLGDRLPEMAREGKLESCLDIHRTLAEAGLWMRIQHGHLVICDGYDHNQTPVRADSVWSLLTPENVNQLDGGWQPVPDDIFRQVTPAERFSGRRLESCPASDREWHRMRTGPGPQGAIRRELFSDKESLWGYSISHCSPQIEEMITRGEFTWQHCHELFARQGLMLQRQHHGLIVVDAFNHEQTPVKASSIHPDLTLDRAEPQAGPFVNAPSDLFDRVKPESRYNPELAVSDQSREDCRRDPVLRRQRREARAEARADLRARYLAWREQWRKPELRYGERSREIHQACRLRKSHIRVQYDDPVLRKLHYHIAEVQRMQALIRLKEEVRDERQKLIAEGKWYPPSYRQWVEAQAVQGDRAAVSQLRGWDYRDRRKDKSRTTTADRCVILCEPGGTPVYENRGELEARLQKNGSVRFRDRRTDQFVCTDYGDRVVFHNHHDRNELADKLDLIAPVLFERDPRMGFEPEGNDRQFNQVFAEMVAWHNVTERTGHGDYTISRPDVDHHRESSERYYRDYVNVHECSDRSQRSHEDEKGWEPPTPV
ncbi:relaxase NikB [Salmonella enterica subsp. enterica serovar Oranienburg]|nr:relaxase NikB [Salmonella enterica]EBR9059927.1 relaxase NikB [Salmonella enterica subsp. enterica serovar Koketime]EBU8757065.1 relaxase NikB [Salmonella enterica subsp. enterica serovar Offa]EBV0858486.1 relaxase NikB [Salmonella enterica subsp. enterica serovar Anecho]EBY1132871.1 relaxase NikB [Salmonella enterica subsp. enterica serovar Senftenberg]ECA0739806.1 relaxase NikB [Salmonella enterica subsp. enterica serovar Adelaide]ECD6381006.1 relaxase NikB [Salmonella enterica subsp. en